MELLTRAFDAVRSRLTRTRRRPPPPSQPATVDAVIERMRAYGAGLDPDDGVAAFNRMYLRVTELVKERIDEGYFTLPGFLTRLDIVFACRYLDVLDAPAPDKAWEPLLELRAHPGREPIQFALAGMNAHINHDLPVALVETCRQLALNPRSPGVRADYLRVTQVLADVHEEVRRSFLSGVALDVDRHLAPVANLVGTWSIARAREAAWTNAQVLWEIEGVEPLHSEFEETLARTVGMAGRYLLTPVGELV
ncbi:DUF5995 family protein [Georgenia wangjunii]|uniref:DUF5995 family protein n=1 Tax=Georgenia wangjunii TaxID=3117730 RepID=UPI002F26815A